MGHMQKFWKPKNLDEFKAKICGFWGEEICELKVKVERNFPEVN